LLLGYPGSEHEYQQTIDEARDQEFAPRSFICFRIQELSE
jgi:hypothetical protein